MLHSDIRSTNLLANMNKINAYYHHDNFIFSSFIRLYTNGIILVKSEMRNERYTAVCPQFILKVLLHPHSM